MEWQVRRKLDQLFDWPGKTNSEGDELPAVIHMLDVAACAEELIKDHTAFDGLSDAQRQAMILLVALHDVGKMSESFRSLVRDGKTGAPRHWQLSDYLLCSVLDETLATLGADKCGRIELYAAVAGHHGQPPARVIGHRTEMRRYRRAVGEGQTAAREWVTQLLRLLPNAALGEIGADEAKSLSWTLSGLTVTSDWVGSCEEWFPLKRNLQSLAGAFAESRQRAGRAIEKAGLNSPPAAQIRSGLLAGMSELRPMQEAAMSVDLEEGPQLVILEDSTGTGKTEAAVILAWRMIRARKARGLFFALPTMATSDAVYERMRSIVPDLFESMPPTVLAHGRAKLYEAMRGLRGGSDDKTPEADHAEWLVDSRRRALLATVCVGTIDQALLGILPTRFSTLRLFGLADRVLIVDEAHSYDPYMQEELKALLRMQATLGGSAVVMTATLPLSLRQSYVEAFQGGLAGAAAEPGQLENTNYPGIHLVGKKMESLPVKPFSESMRKVTVERLADSNEAVALLSEMTSRGASCVWVRNAVDEAIASAETLKSRGLKTELLHARYAMVDRLQIEQDVTRRFGKKGEGREGVILVATQVVEASLDLDFDVMVSDLAPVGSLIQRAGRLWRHIGMRPAADRPVAGPTLHVVSPDPDIVEEGWLHEVLGRGAWVYRLDEQWRTARVLFDAGKITSPDGLRNLIERVHGDDVPLVPKAICDEQVLDGAALAEVGIARGNVVDAASGYIVGTRGAVGNDALLPTRLGEPQVTVVLVRRKGGHLIPWADHGDDTMACSLSEVTASRRRFGPLLPNQDVPEIHTLKASWPKWRVEACRVGVVDETSGQVGDHLLYDREKGLMPLSPPT